MALITKKGNYIKVMENGEFYIYDSKKDRDIEKLATPYETVIALYKEKIQEIDEQLSFDTSNFQLKEERKKWCKEMIQYQDDYIHKNGASIKYSLMSKFISDVKDSIPNVKKGSICTDVNTDESYEIAKQYKYWGETEDDN